MPTAPISSIASSVTLMVWLRRCTAPSNEAFVWVRTYAQPPGSESFFTMMEDHRGAAGPEYSTNSEPAVSFVAAATTGAATVVPIRLASLP